MAGTTSLTVLESILDRLPKNKRKELLSELVLSKRIDESSTIDSFPSDDNDVAAEYYASDYQDPQDPDEEDPDDNSEDEQEFGFFDRAMEERFPQTTGGEW